MIQKYNAVALIGAFLLSLSFGDPLARMSLTDNDHA